MTDLMNEWLAVKRQAEVEWDGCNTNSWEALCAGYTQFVGVCDRVSERLVNEEDISAASNLGDSLMREIAEVDTVEMHERSHVVARTAMMMCGFDPEEHVAFKQVKVLSQFALTFPFLMGLFTGNGLRTQHPFDIPSIDEIYAWSDTTSDELSLRDVLQHCINDGYDIPEDETKNLAFATTTMLEANLEDGAHPYAHIKKSVAVIQVYQAARTHFLAGFLTGHLYPTNKAVLDAVTLD